MQQGTDTVVVPLVVPDEPAPSARRARTRERLLDAAFEVFAEEGVLAASVEQVTERAGFTRGAFYSNFASKEDLFAALLQREGQRQLDDLASRIEQLRPSLECETGELSVDKPLLTLLQAVRHDRSWALLFAEFGLMAMREPRFGTAYLAHQQAFERSLLPIVQCAVELAGREFVLDPQVTVRVLADAYLQGSRTALLSGTADDHSTLRYLVQTLTRTRG